MVFILKLSLLVFDLQLAILLRKKLRTYMYEHILGEIYALFDRKTIFEQHVNQQFHRFFFGIVKSSFLASLASASTTSMWLVILYLLSGQG